MRDNLRATTRRIFKNTRRYVLQDNFCRNNNKEKNRNYSRNINYKNNSKNDHIFILPIDSTY